MKKFVLFVLIAALAYIGYMYLTTGHVQVLPEQKMTKEEKSLAAIKSDFIAVRDRYLENDSSNAFDNFNEEPTVEWAQAKIEDIERRLDQLRPKLTTEYAKTETGWLTMEIRKFKKRLRMDEAN